MRILANTGVFTIAESELSFDGALYEVTCTTRSGVFVFSALERALCQIAARVRQELAVELRVVGLVAWLNRASRAEQEELAEALATAGGAQSSIYHRGVTIPPL